VPWFRLDDSFHSHPKVIAAGNEAVGLYVRCGTYAAEHLTDGFIDEDIAELYGASDTGSRRNPGTGKPETLAETLVRTKLWRRARRGWRMRDYLDYNPSASQVRRERKVAADRQRRRRENQSGRNSSNFRLDPVDNPAENSETTHNPTSDGIRSRRDSRRDNGVSHTTPTRPDPYKGSAVTDPARASPARGPTPNFGRPPNPLNGAAERHPSARSVADAIAEATTGRARKDTP
jgi:hypothetical protein